VLEGLKKLVDLQRLDGDRTAFEEEFSAIPGRRAVLAETLSRCDQRLENAKEQLKASELEQRRVEQALQEQEALLQRLEGQQNQVKSNSAYTALLHEMEVARQAISGCETGILEGMDSVENARDTLVAEESEAVAERKRVDVKEKVLDEREAHLSVEIARLSEAREQVCNGLETALLDRYQKILARRQPALALVTGEMCSGCRVGIPAQDFIEVLRSEAIITCMSCGRILLHAEKVSSR
jgi:predicted  nucleic acid-binding Zn-ribbon protein